MSSKKNRIPESKLLKALAELEDTAKGDALEDADPEGGLSTEGEPLSSAAPSGRGDGTKKSAARSSASSPFGSRSSSSSGASSSDSDSDDDDDRAASAMSARKPPMPPKKQGKKVSKAARSSYSGESESSDDDSSSSSSDSGSDEPAEKSFRDRADGDETMRKAIVVNTFIEAMVDQISLAMHDMSKSIRKAFGELEVRLTTHIDNRVAKSAAGQQNFNVRLAKAVAEIGNIVQGELTGMSDMVKSLADQPVSSPRGKAVLSKGEVNQPPWGGRGGGDDRQLAGGSGDDAVQALRELRPEVIGDWLYKAVANNKVDQNVVFAWEADRYDPAMLPEQVRKAAANDLIK